MFYFLINSCGPKVAPNKTRYRITCQTGRIKRREEQGGGRNGPKKVGEKEKLGVGRIELDGSG